MNKKAIRLNIGCGPSGIAGWLNYDWGILPLFSKLSVIRKILAILGLFPDQYVLKWPDFKLVDIRHRFPLKDKSVKYIYCSHVLEHFERWEAKKILAECWRVLEKDGVIRIVVPDISKMLNLYHQTENRPGQMFCRLWWGYDKDEEPKNIFQVISRRFIRDHQWHYDRRELNLILKQVGFKKVDWLGFRRGSVPDLEKLDLDSHENHSLYTEAFKK